MAIMPNPKREARKRAAEETEAPQDVVVQRKLAEMLRQVPEGDEHDQAAIVLQVEQHAITFQLSDVVASCREDPAQLLWWADIASRAERESLVLDARYRRLRSEAIVDQLKRNPKASEWKVRALIDSQLATEELRALQAESVRNVTFLRALLAIMIGAFPSPAFPSPASH